MNSSRPPIVVILGHVDHGKTSLLDFLRRTNIVAKEAGGITQHIRSFIYQSPEYGQITFIDTPGHEAFSKMRERGSKIADLAILVIAADDGVMPQTKQSITFIRNSAIPFIVAINKTDLPTADPDKIKTQLAESDVLVEDFGGDVPSIKISAKTGAGINELLEMINLVSSLNPPQADPEAQLESVVLESRMDSKKGPLATLLIKQGTLKVGQELFQAQNIGKCRAILNSDGVSQTTASPATPVEVLGLSVIPEVGTTISNQPLISKSSSSPAHKSASSANSKFNLIIRADVAGSLEAIIAGLDPETNLISSGTGDIIDSDVLLARTSSAQILGFNVKTSSSVAKLAETEKVQIRTFHIIYEVFQYLSEWIHPKNTEQIVGKATVLADFKIDADRIAGCRCTEGSIEKSHKVKIQRGGELVGETRIRSIRQGKSVVEKVKSGVEFGALFSPYVDFKVGDDIIATIG